MWKLAAVENCIKLQIANAHFHHHAKSFERTKHYNEDIFAWRGMDFSPCLLAIIVQLRNCKKHQLKIFFSANFFVILQYHSINFIRLSVTLMTEKGLTTHKRISVAKIRQNYLFCQCVERHGNVSNKSPAWRRIMLSYTPFFFSHLTFMWRNSF